MGVRSEINLLVKKAQLIMPPVYRYEAYRKGADKFARGAKALVESISGGVPVVGDYATRAAMTVPGALAGAFAGANEADRAHGWESFSDWGRFKDSLESIWNGISNGAKVGWREAPYAKARLGQSISNAASEVVPGVVDIFSVNAGNNVRKFQNRYTPLGSWRDYATSRVDSERPGYMERTYGKDFADEHERLTSDLKALQMDAGSGNISEDDPRHPEIRKRMEDLDRRIEELAKDSRFADLLNGEGISEYSNIALNLAGGGIGVGALSTGVGALGRIANATRIGMMAPRTVWAASKAPSYALKWKFYGGPKAVDKAKDWLESRRELEAAEEWRKRNVSATEIPSWGQYASPNNTVSSVYVPSN